MVKSIYFFKKRNLCRQFVSQDQICSILSRESRQNHALVVAEARVILKSNATSILSVKELCVHYYAKEEGNILRVKL